MNLNRPIYETLNQRLLYDDTRLGIELEYEGYAGDPIDDRLEYWSLVADHSLRNGGIEYVSVPLGRDDIASALAVAGDHIEDNGLEANARCGVHVHMNVMPWTWSQLWSFSAMYLILEPTIFRTFAPGREISHFCVPSFCNTALTQMMQTDIQMLRRSRARVLRPNLLECPKYSALNYKPIDRLGTIELRQLLGTTDMLAVQRWCEFILALQDKAMTFNDPMDVISSYEEIGLPGMAESVNIHTCDVDELDQEDADDAANLICGYEPVRWQELEWEIKEVI